MMVSDDKNSHLLFKKNNKKAHSSYSLNCYLA